MRMANATSDGPAQVEGVFSGCPCVFSGPMISEVGLLLALTSLRLRFCYPFSITEEKA